MTATPIPPALPERLYAYLPFAERDALFRQEIAARRPSQLGEAYDVLPELGDLAFNLPEIALLEQDAARLMEAGLAGVEGLPESLRQWFDPKVLPFNRAEAAAFRTFLGQTVAELMRVVDRAVHVLRFSEDANNPALWLAQADNHAGLVIEIDPRHPGLFRPDPALAWAGRLLRVSYAAERPSFLRSAVPGPDAYGIDELLTTRPLACAAEREWRVLAVVDRDPALGADTTSATTPHLLALPAAAVTRVILGARTRPAETDTVLGRLRADPAFAHVAIDRAVVQPATFGVFYRPISR